MIAPFAFSAGRAAPSRRFTLDGDRALEDGLELACARALSGVRGLISANRLEAVLLAGGYGRGEGGVRNTSAGDRPYNDLEFYVVLRGPRLLNEARYRPALEALGHILGHQTGVEIEFKVASAAGLAGSGPNMFLHDLLAGHRLLWGSEAALARCLPHAPAERIPISEAVRLLMNRGTGLLLARARLEAPGADGWSDDDADFVRRNLAKAQLACGDAVLTVCRLYHGSCRERHLRLRRLVTILEDRKRAAAGTSAAGNRETSHPSEAAGQDIGAQPSSFRADTASGTGRGEADRSAAPEYRWAHAGGCAPSPRWLGWISDHHAAGVAFKLHPDDAGESRETLALRHAEVGALVRETWLWVEGVRLGTFFPSTLAYAESADDKWPDSRRWRTALLNLRAGAGSGLFRHPRGRVLSALALLLWERPSLDRPAIRRRLRRLLGTETGAYPAVLEAYLRLWRKVQ
ncbi:MAG: hypothetical protein ACREFX_05615 [Opitutaceae bacterium]